MSENWRPAASLATLRARAELMDAVRRFFRERGLLEVETPLLSAAAGTDPNLEPLHTRYEGPEAPSDGLLYLHTSPEFPMKRLLAAGSGPVWQISRVFRGGERGPRHNPEFTMLEWYRPGWDHRALMVEVAELVAAVAGPRPVRERTHAEAFASLGVDPHRDDAAALDAAARANGVTPPDGLERDALLDLLFSHAVAPELGHGRIEFVHDFPAEQAALARVREGDPPVAERFECYLDGMEIANGFHELADAAEQRRRFVADQQRRRARGQPVPPVDERLLAALQAGLPDCAGVALGLDRLFMVALGARRIDEVLAFPLERA
ncbi:EF-P lysine aminoacylase EpmA [Aquisalimonas lutea]|uniref:EF-P lysine aminoacylase EpmA n=1 Tax=Aquisalimonas lutea TaxID=1327750 RepID=UPI0025B61471|nr:EF-P lysine aminoacylase EpmA [Aquisalimonas lutea]MDN3517647.1 EF-P lysine aminoacylase EpmA [Aquisalimonas lutea]